KSTGEIVSLKQIPEESPVKIKYFDIQLRYDSRSGIHNMYREYRDSGAVTQCYRDMRACHRARAHSIQIIKVEVVKAANCKRPQVKQFRDSKIRFPFPNVFIIGIVCHFSMLKSHAPIFFEYFGLNDLYISMKYIFLNKTTFIVMYLFNPFVMYFLHSQYFLNLLQLISLFK
ncbi:60S ribosomal protein L18a, partial [Melipona quadrifasciata]